MKLIKLTANRDSFQTVEFRDGLNVIRAERTESSRGTDSRNGTGKTTMLEVLDFCLGSKVRDDGTLTKLVGNGWEFRLEIELDGRILAVTRSPDLSNEIRVEGLDAFHEIGPLVEDNAADPAQMELEGVPAEASQAAFAPVAGPKVETKTVGQWNSFLGLHLYAIPTADGATRSYSPSFRRTLHYSLRVSRESYLTPFETYAKQPTWQVQVDNAFLLSLDWQAASEWQVLRDRKKTLDALGRRGVSQLLDRQGEIEAELVAAQTDQERVSDSLAAFNLLPEYREVELRANRSTRVMQQLQNSSTGDARLIELYEVQLQAETLDSGGVDELERMYADAGVLFPENVKRSLADVAEFHRRVGRNRRAYLETELRRLNEAQKERSRLMEEEEAQRRDDLRLLESSGALEDLTLLQRSLSESTAKVEMLLAQLRDIGELRRSRSSLRSDQISLQERATRDRDERRERLGAMIREFGEITETLYGEGGALIIDVQDSGYRFRTQMKRESSTGVGNMTIFAYDFSVFRRRHLDGEVHPKVLMHDSVLFDGVDERQTARALAWAAKATESVGGQYIISLNSDAIPYAELAELDFDLDACVVLHLTDASDEGTLLGYRV